VNIKLKWDQSQLDVFAGSLPKRFAYASVNALKATVKRVQLAEFARARSVFSIRKQAFFFGTDKRVGGVAARITTFPSVKRGIAFAEIEGGALPRGGDELGSFRRLLYGGFETGLERRPFTPGAKSVAVPRTGGPARPTAGAPITPELTFARMRLQAFFKSRGPGGRQLKLKRNTRSRKGLGVGVLGEFGRLALPSHDKGISWKGAQRTFMIFNAKHPGGAVLQRTSSSTVRLVWLTKRPFQLDRRLEFLRTAETAAATFFAEETARQIEDVLKHDAAKALRVAA
jgi:hypothetical protein